MRIKRKKRFNVDLFDDARLAHGLSLNQLALAVEFAPQTIRRAFVLGSDPHPDTVRRLGEYFGIPPEKWYIRSEEMNDEAPE
ncbi:hypothetical protein KSF_084150 [Reticulibacter mediterranei]|uniref:HTH cro/C1-type domain-containing protein n=1 Tax=Reticulibacter mediterranei TaxID=2778369 RepID=A0A8J3IX10_9CHLR|nr:helix-turn-helix transcriptional regulator [Reticulibacter mediterranei]GHO98367.1 hypothetical protein KSF_084150 [Reticulibacter mediterranei]